VASNDMVRVYYSGQFEKKVKKLSEKQQAKLAQLVVLLKDNPFNPKLHTKSLAGKLIGIYSFRLERDFRALFKFLSRDEIIIFKYRKPKRYLSVKIV
jgi:toxin HigB-1